MVLAAIQTAIAGLLALLHNSGLPERYRCNEGEFALVETISGTDRRPLGDFATCTGLTGTGSFSTQALSPRTTRSTPSLPTAGASSKRPSPPSRRTPRPTISRVQPQPRRGKHRRARPRPAAVVEVCRDLRRPRSGLGRQALLLAYGGIGPGFFLSFLVLGSLAADLVGALLGGR